MSLPLYFDDKDDDVKTYGRDVFYSMPSMARDEEDDVFGRENMIKNRMKERYAYLPPYIPKSASNYDLGPAPIFSRPTYRPEASFSNSSVSSYAESNYNPTSPQYSYHSYNSMSNGSEHSYHTQSPLSSMSRDSISSIISNYMPQSPPSSVSTRASSQNSSMSMNDTW